jgi:hypothetical protein
VRYAIGLWAAGVGDARTLAEAGATWWNEFIEPPDMDLEMVRQNIRRGPLRMD